MLAIDERLYDLLDSKGELVSETPFPREKFDKQFNAQRTLSDMARLRKQFPYGLHFPRDPNLPMTCEDKHEANHPRTPNPFRSFPTDTVTEVEELKKAMARWAKGEQ
jgi:hypothetical protein